MTLVRRKSYSYITRLRARHIEAGGYGSRFQGSGFEISRVLLVARNVRRWSGVSSVEPVEFNLACPVCHPTGLELPKDVFEPVEERAALATITFWAWVKRSARHRCIQLLD